VKLYPKEALMRVAHVLSLLGFGVVVCAGSTGCSSSTDGTSGAPSTTADSGAPSTTVDIATIVPADKEFDGWAVDPAAPVTLGQVKVARSSDQAYGDLAMDGSAAPFYKTGHVAVALALQNYTKDTLTNALTLVQMASAAECSWLYTDILENSLYQGPWAEVSLGDKGRVLCLAARCRVNACKGPYFVVTSLFGDDSQAAQDAAVSFEKGIISKIP
jgi:hypothetical protein